VRALCNTGRDCCFPGASNSSRVRFRPGFISSGYKRHGFKVQNLFCRTSTNSRFEIDFRLLHIIDSPYCKAECNLLNDTERKSLRDANDALATLRHAEESSGNNEQR
jgi:hypothetical protein